MSKDFYKILNIDKTATEAEIRHAYRKMALLYHPDKNNTNEAKEKFEDVSVAYSILSDIEKRKEYDNMTENKQKEFYDVVKKLFSKMPPKFSNLTNNIIKFFYHDENEFKQDINNIDITAISNKIRGKLNTLFVKEDDNIVKLETTIEERYAKSCKKIKVNNEIIEIPLYENKCSGNNYCFEIETKLNEKYNIVSDFDLIMNYEMSLHDFLFTKNFDLDHFGEKITVNKDSELEFYKLGTLHIIQNKGLPKNKYLRGNLIVQLIIKDLDKFKNIS